MEKDTPPAGTNEEQKEDRPGKKKDSGKQGKTTTEDMVREQGADSSNEPES